MTTPSPGFGRAPTNDLNICFKLLAGAIPKSDVEDVNKMALKILVIDDNEEERAKAKAAVEAAGHEAIVKDSIEGLFKILTQADGVLTDLYFSTSGWAMPNEVLPPAGLLVVIAALQHNKPVVICTSGNHHGPELSWIHDDFRMIGYMDSELSCPFGWADDKDWGWAMGSLQYKFDNPT